MKCDGQETCKLCDKVIIGYYVCIPIHGKYHNICELCEKQLYYYYIEIVKNKLKNR